MGKVALDSGIIYNLRFFGDFVGANKDDGSRNYIEDNSLTDPVWRLIKILFPSGSGALGTTTIADTNFARYVHDPKTIALLLKQAHDVRHGLKIAKDAMSNVLTSLSFPTDYKKKKITNIGKRTIGPLLENIEQSVLKEREDGFYPIYFTETVLLAFFAKKFNHQMDIWRLLNSLNKVFNTEIAKNIPQEEKLLTEISIKNIGPKKERHNEEEIYNLLNADMFTKRPIPYREKQLLIENETICAYIRKTDEIKPQYNFADCAETAIRHVWNLLLYEPKQRIFDLSRFEENRENQSRFYPALVEFFNIQTPNRANDSSRDIRVAANKVVADMNEDDDEIKIRYVRDYNNETETGFINLVRILQKIFNIKLDALPSATEQWQEWLKSSLPIVFQAINPNLQYKFDFYLPKANPTDLDIYGRINITAIRDGIPQFSFVIYESDVHAKVTDIKILVKVDTSFEQYKEVAQKSLINSKLEPYQNGLLLLADQTAADEPYTTFFKTLDNNDARIDWLKRIKTRTDNLHTNIILVNVLKAMSWDDDHIVKQLSEEFKGFLDDDRYREILIPNIASLSIDDKLRDILYKNNISIVDFINLKKIVLLYAGPSLDSKDLPQNIEAIVANKIENISLEKLDQLKNIKITGTTIKKLSLNDLPSLEILTLQSIDFSDIELNNLNKLKTINLAGSRFKNLANFDLSSLPALEELILSSTGRLEEVSLENLSNLKHIKLTNSSVARVILKDLPQLANFNLPLSKNLKEISLDNLANIENLDFQVPRGLDTLGIDLSKVSFINMDNLKDVKFNDGINIQIAILKNLPELKNLYLYHLNKSLVLENIDLAKSESVIIGAYVKEAVIINSTIHGIDFSYAEIKKSNFSGSKINNVKFIRSHLPKSNFTGAILTNVDFTDAVLTESVFKDAYFENVNFTNAVLNKINFTNSNITKEHLKQAKSYTWYAK